MAQNYVPQKKHFRMPWWVDIIWVLLLSFGFLYVASFIRVNVGLPYKTHGAGYPWIGYTICWLAFVIMGHSGWSYRWYFPLSGIAVFVVTVATFLIP